MNNAPKEAKLPLAVALHQYWRHLIGIAVFPTVCLLGFYLHLPAVLYLLLFVGAAIHAEWPYWAKDAPYAYHLLIGLVWVGGLFAVFVLSRLIWLAQWLFGSHHL